MPISKESYARLIFDGATRIYSAQSIRLHPTEISLGSIMEFTKELAKLAGIEVEEESTEFKDAVVFLGRVWNLPGEHPPHHYAMKEKLKSDWPLLYKAILGLDEAYENETRRSAKVSTL